MDDVVFTVPGDPVSKGRPRVTRGGRAYTPKKTLDAEAVIRTIARESCSQPYDEPVGVEVSFYTATMRRTDGDNMLKLVLDAMNEIVFTDDYLVEDVHYRVYRKHAGEEPRTEVCVFPLDAL